MLGKKIQYFLMTGTVMIPIDFFFLKKGFNFQNKYDQTRK